jgi:hypothetical protein
MIVSVAAQDLGDGRSSAFLCEFSKGTNSGQLTCSRLSFASFTVVNSLDRNRTAVLNKLLSVAMRS